MNLIHNLEVVLGLSDEIHLPSSADNSVDEREEFIVTIMACALCKGAFPKLDIVVA